MITVAELKDTIQSTAGTGVCVRSGRFVLSNSLGSCNSATIHRDISEGLLGALGHTLGQLLGRLFFIGFSSRLDGGFSSRLDGSAIFDFLNILKDVPVQIRNY